MASTRVQFDFTPEAPNEVDRLLRRSGLKTRAVLVRHALRLFGWILDQTKDPGTKLLIERNGVPGKSFFLFGILDKILTDFKGAFQGCPFCLFKFVLNWFQRRTRRRVC